MRGQLTRQLYLCDCLVNLEEKFQQNSVVPLGTNGLIRQAIASVFVCLFVFFFIVVTVNKPQVKLSKKFLRRSLSLRECRVVISFIVLSKGQ